MDVVFFESAAEFRAWLDANHATATELSVGYHKKATGRPSMTWAESVDQALCYGWIDGVRRSVDDERYTIRFTPRKPTSNWSLVNVRRVAELTEAGLMMPAGLHAFALRDEARTGVYSSERRPEALPAELEARFKTDPAAWAFFEAQPAGYRRTAIHWVVSAKREKTRQKRLSTLMDDSAHGRRIALLTRPTRGSET
ncbi:MAG: YdeI/OmpD-associated family protein [Chloroflexota bacterium]